MNERQDFRKRLSVAVKEAGKYLVCHADEIIGDLPLLAELTISISLPGGGDAFPEVKVEHRVFSREVTNAYLTGESSAEEG